MNINLKEIRPEFDSEFDIEEVIKECDAIITNTKNESFLENFQNTKLLLWLLRHYVKEHLIPTKTSNPSEEKGSIANLVKQFCKEKQYYDDGKKILEQFAEWAKANGETPEVDNPVPSIDNNDINWLIELSANWINKNYSKADGKRFELIKSKLQNGRETE